MLPKKSTKKKDNNSALFEIESNLRDLCQGEFLVTYYYNTLTMYWQQLDMFEEYKWEYLEDGMLFKKIIE